MKTLLISEDHRFYEHSGLDLPAYLRVIFGVITFSKQGGGSTLTQQTAKNLFRTREEELQGTLGKLAGPMEILISKTKEWIIAVELEKNFTKEEIIALYLNTVPFNNNAYGIRVAAETYFKKLPGELNLQESALLVGMLQGTTLFNPVTHPERALRKRNEVLDKMLTHGHIKTNKDADSLKALPLQLNFSVLNHNKGLAQYFRSVLQQELSRWCKERNLDLLNSGLRIYTTIDSRVQRYAEEAMAEHMRYVQKEFDKDWGNRNPWVDENGQEVKDFITRKLRRSETYQNLVARYGEKSDSLNIKIHEKKVMRIFTWNGERDTLFSSYDSVRYYNRFLQTGLIAMHPVTGEVKAWVGGINHKYFQFDHVRQGSRQAGSTFKPFVYGLAMENGYSPCERFRDSSPMIMVNGASYQPKNSNGTYGDQQFYTLRQALARSLNSVTLQLMDKLKPQNVVDFAHRLGISSELDAVYALALGTSDVTLYEMVNAYTTFVNKGIYTKAFYITRIEDKNGNVLENFVPVSKQALDENTAYKIVHLLKGGVEEAGGTSGRLNELIKTDNEVGGKTGTTDNGSDGWYIGITHNLVTGVWVGGEERSIHFPRWGESSGGRTALPIWEKFMTKIYQHPETGFPKGAFEKPVDFSYNLDCSQHIPDSTFNIDF